MKFCNTVFLLLCNEVFLFDRYFGSIYRVAVEPCWICRLRASVIFMGDREIGIWGWIFVPGVLLSTFMLISKFFVGTIPSYGIPKIVKIGSNGKNRVPRSDREMKFVNANILVATSHLWIYNFQNFPVVQKWDMGGGSMWIRWLIQTPIML